MLPAQGLKKREPNGFQPFAEIRVDELNYLYHIGMQVKDSTHMYFCMPLVNFHYVFLLVCNHQTPTDLPLPEMQQQPYECLDLSPCLGTNPVKPDARQQHLVLCFVPCTVI